MPAPSSADLRSGIDAYLHASNATAAEQELASAIAIAKARKDVLASLLTEYGTWLADDQADPSAPGLPVARVCAFLAGQLGYADLLEPHMSKRSPAWAWVAFADSRGVVLYYAFVEGGNWDLLMAPALAKEVAIRSPHVIGPVRELEQR